MATSDAEVLIPTWNRRVSLAATLDSLRLQTSPCGVCVIDNGSSDGTAEMVERTYPEARLVRLDSNRGFAAAVNAGARSSGAEWVVLLNNDARADREFVARLEQAWRRTAAEMVAACMRQPDGTVDTLGVALDQSLVPYELCHGEPYEAAVAGAPEPLAPCGGAAAFRREAFLAAGGFDEAIFAYLEDAELGVRMRIAGSGCATAYDAFVWHEHAGTLGSGSASKNELIARGRSRLLWKHGANLGPVERLRGAAIDAAVYGGQALIDRNLGSVKGRLAARRERRGEPRPPAVPGFERVPLRRLGLVAALRLKLGRRL